MCNYISIYCKQCKSVLKIFSRIIEYLSMQALNIYPKFAGANVFQSRELFPFVSRIKESERFEIYLFGNKPFLVILSYFAYESINVP